MNKKPCPYCELGNDSKSLQSEFGKHHTAYVEKGYIYVSIGAVDAQFSVKYCPNCGRELDIAESKKLNWKLVRNKLSDSDEWIAEGSWGTFYVFSDTEGIFTASLNNEIESEGDFKTIEEAKAYCQGYLKNLGAKA